MLTTVAAGRVFDYSFCLGMYGMSGQGFWSPQDMALGDNGVIYVINRGAEELGQRISRVTLEHQFLGQFGAYGRGDGQFVWPRSIALDSDGNVFATDDFLNRVSVFGAEGAFLSSWGQPGSGEGRFNGPAGIAFDDKREGADGSVVIADSLNHRIQRFTAEGEYLGGFGGHGDGDGRLDMPWGLCIGGDGAIYVADWKNNRVQKFDADGNFLLKFEASGSGLGALRGPTGVAVDSEGDVYVADWGNHQVQVYAPDGRFIASLVGDAQQPSPWTQTYIDANPDIIKARRRVDLEPEWRFRRPVAVKVDENDRIYVLEAARHRMQVYDKVKDYEEHPLNL